jgi:hypothetical protein
METRNRRSHIVIKETKVTRVEDDQFENQTTLEG